MDCLIVAPLDDNIDVRIDASQKAAFQRKCQDANTTPSQAIRRYIRDVLKGYQTL